MKRYDGNRVGIEFVGEVILVRLSHIRAVVLKLGSIEPQRFIKSVSRVRRQDILSNKSKIDKIHDTHFIFQVRRVG